MTKEEVVRNLVIFFDYSEEDALALMNQYMEENPTTKNGYSTHLPIIIATIG